jgi:riboflavin kinase/FMN adenylyltransferase
MRIHSGIAATARRLTRGSLAIGNFDGVHLGHRGLFEAAKSAAQRLGGPTCALTFEPHPARLLAPDYAPPLICTPVRKRELLAEAGIQDLVVQPFDRAFSETEPDGFVDLLLATGVAEVVVGHDFTYGRQRRGTVATLRTALEQCGVRLNVVSAITVHGLVVSSTKIREFMLEGRVEATAQLLGRPFDLDGDVVRGVGRGRKLGWPTANIRTQAELLPAVGVYAVRARRIEEPSRCEADASPGGPVRYIPPRVRAAVFGAANLGLNPTFRADAHAGSGREPLMLEVHLFDVDEDLYGSALRVEFVHRLRDERRFPNVDALKEQIGRDVAEARRLLGA